MSYSKIGAALDAVGEPAKIRFMYDTTKIFNSVSIRTMYRANAVKDQKGESQLDDFGISPDELPIMKEFLADAIYELGAEIFKLTNGISNSIFIDKNKFGYGINEPVTDATALPTTAADTVGKLFKVKTTAWGGFAVDDVVKVATVYSATGSVAATFIKCESSTSGNGFEIKDNVAFNANLLPSLDKKIEACLKYFILREWYGSTGMDKDMANNAALYNAHLTKVKNLTFQLRKPLMS